jgi:ferric-dicitrate binding protein FerR (iron transport regulator)
MTISAGPLEIQDIGTRFDVQTDDMAVRVAVAQGSLSIASGQLDQSIRLSAGHGLALDARKGTPRRLRLIQRASDNGDRDNWITTTRRFLWFLRIWSVMAVSISICPPICASGLFGDFDAR